MSNRDPNIIIEYIRNTTFPGFYWKFKEDLSWIGPLPTEQDCYEDAVVVKQKRVEKFYGL